MKFNFVLMFAVSSITALSMHAGAREMLVQSIASTMTCEAGFLAESRALSTAKKDAMGKLKNNCHGDDAFVLGQLKNIHPRINCDRKTDVASDNKVHEFVCCAVDLEATCVTSDR